MTLDLAELAPLDALFLSPHPDDVELFCGGTVAALVDRGLRVAVVDLTAGERASNGTPEIRREESLRAAEALGLSLARPVLGLPDAGVDAESSDQLDGVLELLERTRPRLLFAPHPEDRHPDHVATGRLARQAHASLSVESDVEPGTVLYEYPCHTLVPVQRWVDVSAQMPRRRAAVACYGSQFVREEDGVPTPINEPEFLARNEERLRAWGERVGVAYAEGFCGDAAAGFPTDFWLEGDER